MKDVMEEDGELVGEEDFFLMKVKKIEKSFNIKKHHKKHSTLSNGHPNNPISPTPNRPTKLIRKLCLFRRFDIAHHLLDQMPTPPDEDIFVVIVRGLGRARMVRQVVKVLEFMVSILSPPIPFDLVQETPFDLVQETTFTFEAESRAFYTSRNQRFSTAGYGVFTARGNRSPAMKLALLGSFLIRGMVHKIGTPEVHHAVCQELL
ncbi:pentatricopeptide repeat-containing protein, mitochondrial [Artemisia annua]|uniref:Pentatricopeptide repeat-containing protein, mitochondrial n=1 Tax=Artemisia annua TaxID=35608 RepID=A0A2U1PJF1_ARTAN|nr:pentatricopeptide repeat-containing protein, mitochondrial [Artemisia annua]